MYRTRYNYRNSNRFCNCSCNSRSYKSLLYSRACRDPFRCKRFVLYRTGKCCTVDSPSWRKIKVKSTQHASISFRDLAFRAPPKYLESAKRIGKSNRMYFQFGKKINICLVFEKQNNYNVMYV